jgi:predicted DNA-binding protein (MmcQ/YjbR family)
MGRKDVAAEGLERLREFGLRYPGAHTKSPWPGHLDLAVRDKTFAYLSVAGEPVKVSCKLPRSAELALSFPFATPTEYGLGKSGWVTARFPDGAPLPEELLQQWIDESYRAQAPKRLSAAAPPLAAVEVSASTTAADGGAKVARARAKVTGARAKVPARAAASAKGRTAPARPTAKRAAKARPKAPAAKRAAAPSRPSAPAAKRKKAAQRRPRASG